MRKIVFLPYFKDSKSSSFAFTSDVLIDSFYYLSFSNKSVTNRKQMCLLHCYLIYLGVYPTTAINNSSFHDFNLLFKVNSNT